MTGCCRVSFSPKSTEVLMANMCMTSFENEVLLLDFIFIFTCLFNFKDFYLNVCICFACMYTCGPHVYSACRGQKGALDSLGLELERVVSDHGGAGTQTQVSGRSTSVF